MAKRIGVVLSGCGVFDGSEIHEAVLSLLALARRGYEVVCLAPNIPQAHVFNHGKGAEAEGETRNVLDEAARIARGKITNIATVSAADFDALFFPGGFGAAKNLSSFAFDGPGMKVHSAVETLIRAMHAAGKPMGFVCIAPAIAAKVLSSGVELTIGNDTATGQALEAMGATHVQKPVSEAHIDPTHKVVSAPAYMYDATILEVEASINAAVAGLAELLGG